MEFIKDDKFDDYKGVLKYTDISGFDSLGLFTVDMNNQVITIELNNKTRVCIYSINQDQLRLSYTDNTQTITEVWLPKT